MLPRQTKRTRIGGSLPATSPAVRLGHTVRESDTVSERSVPSLPVASVTRKPRTEPREARRPEVERRLLQATEDLIADGTSFTELSVEQLASRAGIARSTFYVYFHDKTDLVARLAEEMVAQLAEAASVWWKLGVDARYDDVLESTRQVVNTYARHSALFTALAETAAYDERLRELQLVTMSRYARPMSELIERGKEEGLVRPEIHTSESVVALTWMVERACFHLARGASEERLERIAQSLSQIFWHTLYPDSHKQTAGQDQVPARVQGDTNT